MTLGRRSAARVKHDHRSSQENADAEPKPKPSGARRSQIQRCRHGRGVLSFARDSVSAVVLPGIPQSYVAGVAPSMTQLAHVLQSILGADTPARL
jgi:hypothetical protein